MLSFLPAPVIGVLNSILLGINTLFWCILLYIPAVLKLVVPDPPPPLAAEEAELVGRALERDLPALADTARGRAARDLAVIRGRAGDADLDVGAAAGRAIVAVSGRGARVGGGDGRVECCPRREEVWF